MLEQWLAPYRSREGQVTAQTLNGYTASLILLRKSLKIPSRRNGLRHGFVTYVCGMPRNENTTSALAGNSPTMIHGHYKGLATKADAKESGSTCGLLRRLGTWFRSPNKLTRETAHD